MRQLILVEVVWLAQMAGRCIFHGTSQVLRDGWLASVHTLHDAHMLSLVFTVCVTTCGMMWHDSHCAQMN